MRGAAWVAVVLLADAATKGWMGTPDGLLHERGHWYVAACLAMAGAFFALGGSWPSALAAGGLIANALDALDGQVRNPLVVVWNDGMTALGFNAADVATLAGFVLVSYHVSRRLVRKRHLT